MLCRCGAFVTSMRKMRIVWKKNIFSQIDIQIYQISQIDTPISDEKQDLPYIEHSEMFGRSVTCVRRSVNLSIVTVDQLSEDRNSDQWSVAHNLKPFLLSVILIATPTMSCTCPISRTFIFRTASWTFKF